MNLIEHLIMKVKIFVTVLIIAVGAGLFFSSPIWNSGCATIPPAQEPPQVLIDWAEFLYDASTKNDLDKTAKTLFQVKKTDYQRPLDIYNDPDLRRILGSSPLPDRYAFVSDPDFQLLTDRFNTPKEYRDFMDGFEASIFQIQASIEELRGSHLFPSFFDNPELKHIRKFDGKEEPLRVFTEIDLDRFEQLAWFADNFRSATLNFDWGSYRNHFRDSRRGSTTSVLDYIISLEDVQKTLFASIPEIYLSETLIYIRENFPSE